MVIVFKYAVPKGYLGITIFPFIFLKYQYLRTNRIILNHERIHLRQQLEFLIVLFYLWYGIEFGIRLLYLRNWKKAYQSVSFEREAYANENDFNYLKTRTFFRNFNYL